MFEGIKRTSQTEEALLSVWVFFCNGSAQDFALAAKFVRTRKFGRKGICPLPQGAKNVRGTETLDLRIMSW